MLADAMLDKTVALSISIRNFIEIMLDADDRHGACFVWRL
jgi:hypothetical protein